LTGAVQDRHTTMSPTSLLLSLVLALAGGEALAQEPGARPGSVAPAGEGPRLGVALTVARDRLEVSMVEEGGAAERAGLRVGDSLLEVGGRTLEPGGTGYRALIEALDGLDPAASLELVVARAGERTPLTVEFGLAPSAGSAYLGCSVRDGERGALIDGVGSGSPAERAGLLKGDELLALAGVEIDGTSALLERLGEHRPGERVQLVVARDGDSLLFDLELAERPREPAAESTPAGRGRAPSAVAGTPRGATAAPSPDAPTLDPEAPPPSPPGPSRGPAPASPAPASPVPARSGPEPPFDAAGFEAALGELAETLSSALERAVERLAGRIESAIEAAAEVSSAAAETAELLERERGRRAAAEERLARVEAELAELRAELARVRADLEGIGRALWGDGR
jgi:hypothetical protein